MRYHLLKWQADYRDYFTFYRQVYKKGFKTKKEAISYANKKKIDDYLIIVFKSKKVLGYVPIFRYWALETVSREGRKVYTSCSEAQRAMHVYRANSIAGVVRMPKIDMVWSED